MSEWCAGGLARSLGGYFGRLDAPWAVGCVQPAVAVFALFRMLLLATRKRRDGLSWDRRGWPAATSSQPLTLAAGVQRSGDPSSVLFSRRAAGSRAHAAWHHGAMKSRFRWSLALHSTQTRSGALARLAAMRCSAPMARAPRRGRDGHYQFYHVEYAMLGRRQLPWLKKRRLPFFCRASSRADDARKSSTTRARCGDAERRPARRRTALNMQRTDRTETCSPCKAPCCSTAAEPHLIMSLLQPDDCGTIPGLMSLPC
jgi:hypothetical protein